MPRTNNFDLVRLILAWMVVFYHAAILSAATNLAWIPRWCSGTVAVEGFFAISGCLIAMSYDRNSGLNGYIARRAARILPAYYASALFVLGLGLFLTRLQWWQFLTSRDTLKYYFGNLIFYNHYHPSLPGLFANNPLGASVNGALWTIKVEIMFYSFVPIFFWLCRHLGRIPIISFVIAASLVYQAVFARLGNLEAAQQFPGALCFFMIGAAVYFYYPFFRRYPVWMWSAAGASLLVYLLTDIFAFRAIGVSLLTMCAALLLPVFRGPTGYGDFSYGAYVLHYPVIQALASCGLFALSPWLGMAACTVCVLLLSIFSWNLAEKRFLQRKPLVRAECRNCLTNG
jgi:peptidoglycan/LPS O-acetylase OafA/YrhL